MLLGGAVAWPVAARAQQSVVPVVGFVHIGSADVIAHFVAAFRKGLNETGYAKGQNVTVEYHRVGRQNDRLQAVMADLVKLLAVADEMTRRELITLLGSMAVAWPLAARAQQTAKLPTIGYLGATTPSAESQRVAALVQRLGELGWIESRNLTIEYRYAEGRSERYTELAAEFVRLNVDVIVTYGTPAVAATKQATAVIPIVFAVAGDPIGSGLVASLPRPGGNVTGLSLQKTDVADKRLDLLREVVPGLRGLAVMANAASPVSVLEMREVESTARRLGHQVATFEIRRADDIAPTFEALKGRADALYVCGDPLVDTNRIRIITLALGARLPSISDFPEYVEAGGLMSYGPNFPDLFRRAAGYVDKILRGAKPGDIPVEQPTKFDLVINLITAKALGLDVSPTLLARADEVIE